MINSALISTAEARHALSQQSETSFFLCEILFSVFNKSIFDLLAQDSNEDYNKLIDIAIFCISTWFEPTNHMEFILDPKDARLLSNEFLNLLTGSTSTQR